MHVYELSSVTVDFNTYIALKIVVQFLYLVWVWKERFILRLCVGSSFIYCSRRIKYERKGIHLQHHWFTVDQFVVLHSAHKITWMKRGARHIATARSLIAGCFHLNPFPMSYNSYGHSYAWCSADKYISVYTYFHL